MRFRTARAEDLERITELLSRFRLPVNDIRLPRIQFIIAEDNDALAGCIGLEIFGKEGLLRSLAVDDQHRNKKIGRQLVNYLQAYAVENSVANLHLLSETAEDYFHRLGFSKAKRDSAPDAIKETEEFSVLCPSHSVYMVKENISDSPAYFPSALHIVKKDRETGASYWKMSSGQMSFTRFSVPPEQTFSAHAHESEQMTYVLEGKLFFDIDEETFVLEKGDFIFIPSHKKHRVRTETEGAEALDAWSPVINNY